jgi:2-methylcitrate dehydratase PrpD
VAYIDRAAGVVQFTNERSGNAEVQALRKLIQVKPDSSYRLDQAAVRVRTRSGTTHVAQIAHATGTVNNPMPDQALREKFLGNATPVIGADQARRVADVIWKLETLSDVGELVRACG